MNETGQYAMTASTLAKMHGAIGAGFLDNELRRLEQERSKWLNATSASHSFADQISKLMEPSSAAVQMAQQMYDAQKAQEESIRKMLDPLESIRASLLNDSATQRMLEELTKPAFASDHFNKLIDKVTGPNSQLSSLFSHAEESMEQARRMLAETSVSNNLQQMMKGFEEVNKRWAVPSSLMDAMAPLQAWQEQIGKLSLPVMDMASAATLAKLLGREGIESQLAALGINPDGSLNAQFAEANEEVGLGLSRRSLELITLLSFILALLVPIYQEISSARSQSATDEKLTKQAEALEAQRKMIESLAKLVEKALVDEAKQQKTRFVVKDRVALVRSSPGSGVVGKLFPQEVVRPISEDGKWIQFEYYHWLHQEYRTGWALKKYFQRVARPSSD